MTARRLGYLALLRVSNAIQRAAFAVRGELPRVPERPPWKYKAILHTRADDMSAIAGKVNNTTLDLAAHGWTPLRKVILPVYGADAAEQVTMVIQSAVFDEAGMVIGADYVADRSFPTPDVAPVLVR